MSATTTPIGTGLLSPNAEPSNKLQTYIHHLERKINALTRTAEKDRAICYELAKVKHKDHMNTSSPSNGSGEDQP